MPCRREPERQLGRMWMCTGNERGTGAQNQNRASNQVRPRRGCERTRWSYARQGWGERARVAVKGAVQQCRAERRRSLLGFQSDRELVAKHKHLRATRTIATTHHLTRQQPRQRQLPRAQALITSTSPPSCPSPSFSAKSLPARLHHGRHQEEDGRAQHRGRRQVRMRRVFG